MIFLMVAGIKIVARNNELEGRYYGLKLTTDPINSVFTEGPQVCAYDENTICLSGGGTTSVTMMLSGQFVCFKQGSRYVDFDINDLIALKALLNK